VPLFDSYDADRIALVADIRRDLQLDDAIQRINQSINQHSRKRIRGVLWRRLYELLMHERALFLHRVPRTSSLYFLNNSFKIQPISVIFGAQYYEDILRQRI